MPSDYSAEIKAQEMRNLLCVSQIEGRPSIARRNSTFRFYFAYTRAAGITKDNRYVGQDKDFIPLPSSSWRKNQVDGIRIGRTIPRHT